MIWIMPLCLSKFTGNCKEIHLQTSINFVISLSKGCIRCCFSLGKSRGQKICKNHVVDFRSSHNVSPIVTMSHFFDETVSFVR